MPAFTHISYFDCVINATVGKEKVTNIGPDVDHMV